MPSLSILDLGMFSKCLVNCDLLNKKSILKKKIFSGSFNSFKVLDVLSNLTIHIQPTKVYYRKTYFQDTFNLFKVLDVLFNLTIHLQSSMKNNCVFTSRSTKRTRFQITTCQDGPRKRLILI